MISYLHWHIIELDFNSITIMTSGGVWYEVWISELTYASLSLEQSIEMPVYHHITEGSGIWWKVAMQMLSLWSSRLIWAVRSADNKTIEGIKGIWKKMAEKVILELKDKEFAIAWTTETDSNPVSSDFADVLATLVNMWYDKNNIEKILADMPEDISGIGDIIPYVIKNI